MVNAACPGGTDDCVLETTSLACPKVFTKLSVKRVPVKKEVMLPSVEDIDCEEKSHRGRRTERAAKRENLQKMLRRKPLLNIGPYFAVSWMMYTWHGVLSPSMLCPTPFGNVSILPLCHLLTSI